MASSSNLDPWLSPFLSPETARISDAFARDNEALTEALRISLLPSSAAAPELVFAAPAADPGSDGPDRCCSNPVRLAPTGRIRKRKPRASRRSPTTYISADPANFREMVQLVTGIRFEPGAAVEPAAERDGPGGDGFERGLLLPTLDSSAFSLDQSGMDRVGVDVSFGPGSVEGPVYGLEPTPAPCFPTLESWSVM